VDYTITRSFLCVPQDCGKTYIAEDNIKSCHLYIYQTPVSDFQVLLGVLSASCFTKKPLDDLIRHPCIILILCGTLMVRRFMRVIFDLTIFLGDNNTFK
jgi:hypothetical protein